jgi:hypothetical protein
LNIAPALKARTDVWLTPPCLIEALGGWESFDLDPCAAVDQPYPTAKTSYTEIDNGLMLDWFGRVWLNPPYSQRLLSAFLERMVMHGHGLALIFARTETEVFHRYVWDRAVALLFVRSRIKFHRPSGSRAADGVAPSVLIAYSAEDADMLSIEPVPGKFVPLKIPFGILVDARSCQTWSQALADLFEGIDGPVRLEDVYRAMRLHPKAKTNRHYREKIRQTLQKGGYSNIARGVWEAKLQFDAPDELEVPA